MPPPNLPRFGGGERPPFSCKPPAPLTITMGQRPCTLQAANQKVFTFLPHSSPPRRRGQGWWFAVLRSSAAAIKMCHRHLIKPICVQYGRLFRRKMPFVSSTAKRQEGLSRGKPGPHWPCFASFCRSKRNAPAASRTGFAPCKIFATPLGDPQSCPEINIFCPPFSHASAYSSTATGFLARK